ncbi:MAG: hypothetical protein VX643_00970 [Chloroflexota bacterium]|nr:hypothetical protein [Chloroflexota bacterium]|tara:strand:- start:1768 stop:1956 length:189 start_codon:yes stop_codon:yes gene_type:complete
MTPLSNQEVQSLGNAVKLQIEEPELTEVSHSINAILDSMAEINLPETNSIEPIPILIPEMED